MGGVTSTNTYDGDGLRVGRTVDGAATSYTWDLTSGNPQILQDGTHSYVYGLGLISAADASGNQTYYHTDGLGSARALTDGNGSTVATYEYDVFGAVRGTTGTANSLFKYTGQQLDSDTGMYYLRARYYDPSVGRFLSKDPFLGFKHEPQTQNPYAYVSNNPARYRDSSGLCAAEGNLGWLDRASGFFGDLFDQAGHAFGGADWDGGGSGGFGGGSGGGRANFCGGGSSLPIVWISRSVSPETARHIEEAWALGYTRILTIDRPGKDARRASSIAGYATAPGMDRDEYPPAVFLENGGSAHVKLINAADNRRAGQSIGYQINNPFLPNGTRVEIRLGP